MLGPYHFCPLLCSSLHETFLDVSNFLEEISSLSHSIPFPVFLWIVYIRRLSFLSLLFSGTLHSVGYVFPFLPCLLFLFSSQLFVRPPQTTILLSCISFSLAHYTVNLFFWEKANILHSVINVEYLLLYIVIFLSVSIHVHEKFWKQFSYNKSHQKATLKKLNVIFPIVVAITVSLHCSWNLTF